MKKIILSLIAIMACMSINAQNVKVYDTKSSTTETVAEYKNSTDHSYKVVFEEIKYKDNEGYDYVDLGLPSGTLWATCNVGANNPEDFGYYFTWGGINGYTVSDKHYFSEELCPWTSQDMDSGDMVYDKYNSDDDLTTLETADDAANSYLGSSWRMPTQEDWEELREYCTFNHTSLNGVKGCYAIGPNDNFIFLPAAGYMDDTGLLSENSEGNYWTSSLTVNNVKYAYVLWFDAGDDDDTRPQTTGNLPRYYGCSVRPVFKVATPTCRFSIIKKTVSVNQCSMDSELKVITNSDGAVTYTSSDESIAHVDPITGYVLGNSKGYATITASVAETMSYHAASASYTVEVTPIDPVLCAFPMDSRSVKIGESFTQTVETNSDGAVTYTSSNTNVAQVGSISGKVTTGWNDGTATITASVAATNKYNAATATYTVTVIETCPTCYFGLDGQTITLTLNSDIGNSYTRGLSTNSSGTITYTSSNTSVVTVSKNSNGSCVVTPVGRGTARVTGTVAASGDFISASDYFVVKVEDANLLSGEFSVSSSKKVLFSKSNLYYDGSNFRFENTQVDYPHKWDSNHVGHFRFTMSSQDSYCEVDENGPGWYYSTPFFAESNGGLNVEGTSGLYVLSKDEWDYLLSVRRNASALCLSGVTVTSNGNKYNNCVVFAPDNYSGPSLVTITDWSLSNANSLGLVVLPACGTRGSFYEPWYGGVAWNDSKITQKDETPYYWTSSPTGIIKEDYSTYKLCHRSVVKGQSYRGHGIRLVVTK